MNVRARGERFLANLASLGARRLAILAAIGAAVFIATGLSGYYMSRPVNEILYSGLGRDDVGSIGSALREAGIPFDVSADGATVVVPVGQTAFARMTLAEKGLPRSGNLGNELFDKLGTLGLTSFMQEVTRVRAVEGELARSILMIRGVKSARVHVVLGEVGTFRREKQTPSASVVIRVESADEARIARTIRQLVASAIPGMSPGSVTVLGSDGMILSAGNGKDENGSGDLLALESEMSRRIQDSVGRTLEPYLSARNFRVSAVARLNIDKKQVSETVFNPESRVERSVRVVKESQSSQNSTGQSAAGVQSNVPQPKPSGGDQKQGTDETQKREELTNYELSSKTIATASAGYVIEALSIAVMVNRASLLAPEGGKSTQEAIDARVKEISDVAATTAGLRKDRGDTIKVMVVDFLEPEREMEPATGSSASDFAQRHFGQILNALTVVAVAMLFGWFGLRPAEKTLAREPAGVEAAPMALTGPSGESSIASAELANSAGDEPLPQKLLERSGWTSLLAEIEERIDDDESRAASVLKQWLGKDETA